MHLATAGRIPRTGGTWQAAAHGVEESDTAGRLAHTGWGWGVTCGQTRSFAGKRRPWIQGLKDAGFIYFKISLKNT